jgi:hypothetical protein
MPTQEQTEVLVDRLEDFLHVQFHLPAPPPLAQDEPADVFRLEVDTQSREAVSFN